MSKIAYLIIVIVIAIFVYQKYPRKTLKTIHQKIGDQSFSLEIANNPILQAKGLSGRSSLCEKCGMLFIFKGDAPRSFWMKDTLIPLDIIFITSLGQITDIYTATPEPEKSSFQLTIYQSTAPTQYVIELNAGTAQKLNLLVGDTINITI